MHQVISRCTAFAFALIAVTATAADVDGIALERSALKERIALRTGEVDLLCVRTGGRDPEEEHLRSEFRIIFDRDKVRFDQKQFRDGPSPFMTAKCVLDPERVAYYSSDPDPSGKEVAAALGDRKEMKAYELGAFDPRLLGIVPFPSTSLHAFRLDTILNRPDRRKTTVIEEESGGYPTCRVEYVRNDGTVVRVWITRENGSHVVRCELQSEHPTAGTVVDSIANTLRRWGPDGEFCFPERILQERHVAGVLAWREDIRVTAARFGQDVDAATFDFRGMDVPPGLAVTESPPFEKGQRVWDGKSLVLRERPPAISTPLQSPLNRAPTIWMILSVNCAAIAAVLLWLYSRPRSGKE